MSGTVTLPEKQYLVQVATRRPRLRLLYTPPHAGPAAQSVYSLTEGSVHIGRQLDRQHPGFEIPGDSAMSSVHALIETMPKTYEVRLSDCQSKNGVWVGRKKLPPQPASQILQDGDILRLGNTFLCLRYEPTRAADAEVPGLIGGSLPMRELRAQLQRIARESLPALILGETGTGKEVVATALHKLSGRHGEMVTQNCAAISHSLAESELFGHVVGSFNNARDRLGRFRRAEHGTLFLDEVGELSIDLQAKLLRAVEERLITPVGSDRPISIDVRIVSATNRDLTAAAEAGGFRLDLLHRLAHVELKLPPLRHRKEDILPLLTHDNPDLASALSPSLVQALLLHDWPGNVRELFVIGRRLRLEGGTEALMAALRPREPEADPVPQAVVQAVEDDDADAEEVAATSRPYRLPPPKKGELLSLMRKHLGTVTNVAKELNCSRRQVQRWLEMYGLDPDDFRKLP